MLKRTLTYTERIFDACKQFYESKKSLYATSVVLVLAFLLCSLLSVLVISGYINLGHYQDKFQNPFFSIEIVFTLLLIIELFGLIFVLPQSVAKSVGKQFELLSLIFLRDGFKEFSHIGTDFNWEHLQESLIPMVVYGFGAIIIFSIISVTGTLQKRFKLTSTEDDQIQFIRLKKLLAILLLVAFAVVGFNDLRIIVVSGSYLHSFQTFYTVLIFSDIIIVLIALRYTLNYYRIFRYSAFVLATILIRVALSAETYYNVAIGITACLFVLALTVSYNYFLKDISKNQTIKQ